MSITSQRIKFKHVNLFAIVSLLLVILAGGIVRSSGSGMGCPDWPKCFGRYIPPTDVSQLPKDYKQKYIEGRVKKNTKFARLLDVFGYNSLAARIRKDKSILIPEEFNTANTWIEYINRLIGVIAGIFLFLTAIFSFSYRNDTIAIPLLSVFNLILVGFQGWLGSIVVSTNLTSWLVTVHMLIALAILAISIYTYNLTRMLGKPVVKVKPLIISIAVAAFIVTIIQIIVGSAVREEVDAVSNHLQGYRQDWITAVGNILESHRTIAIAVLVLNVLLYVLIRKFYSRQSFQRQVMSFTFLMIMLQIVTGIVLTYFMLPPFAQAAHVFIASLVFGAQFYLLLNLKRSALQGGSV